uniref:type II toxin-antitoxin system RelB family antitoxin n=1 Tax=Vaginimicrobium propionicum TaxID=1871034 RepID=UPI0009703239|nr:ribbon-helix-helix domain-containing protein [Vaginimicrobium propionicum]
MASEVHEKPTSVRLSARTMERLDDLAQRTGRSKSYYIRQAVEDSIDRLIWEYDVLSTVEEYRAGRLKTYTLDEVSEHLGLED